MSLSEQLALTEELFRKNEEIHKEFNSLFWNFFIKFQTAITIEEEYEARQEYNKLILYCASLGMPLPEWFTETSTYRDNLCRK